MIRVNLLPLKKARRRSQGRVQLLLFFGLIVIQLVVLAVVYGLVNEELEEKKGQVTELKAEVEALESEVADSESLEAEVEALVEQLRVLSDLEARRIGPVRMLDEIQAMVSPPRNEEDRVSQMRRDWNVDWDTRRLWIQNFNEGDGKFTLNGFAVTADDVAEFLQRMTTAYYFDDVQLDVVERSGSRDRQMVQFRLHGKLSYTGFGNDSGAAEGS